MPKISLRPETRELIITLDQLVRSGTIESEFNFHVNTREKNERAISVPGDKSSYHLTDLARNNGLALNMRNFEKLVEHKLLKMDRKSGTVNGSAHFTIYVEQSLHDLVDRDFEIESPSSSINITADRVTITNANAITIINNNAELADALEARLRSVISAEHAFIFDAIDELRTAVNDTQKQTAFQRIFGAASHVNDAYGLFQIANAIASEIMLRLPK